MNLSDAQEKYKSGATAYFKLENDKDSTKVRFLYEFAESNPECLNLSDVDCYVVHDIEIGGKRRVRQCADVDGVAGQCPDCLSGNKAKLKTFIQLVDLRDNKVKVWERSGKYATKLLGLVARYGPLCSRIYEVERNGVKGSTDTEYNLYALDTDGKTLADLPERLDIMGTMIIPAGQEPQATPAPTSVVGRGTRAPIATKEAF